MNARAHSIAGVASPATPLRQTGRETRRDPGDLQAAVGILTGVAVSVAFWVAVALVIF